MSTKKKFEFEFDLMTMKYLDYVWHISFDKKPTLDQLLDRLADLINKHLVVHGMSKLTPTKMSTICDPDYLTGSCNQCDNDLWNWIEEN